MIATKTNLEITEYREKFFFGAISPPAGLLCCGCGAGDCDLLCLSALAADGYAGRFLYRHGGGAAFFGVGLYPP